MITLNLLPPHQKEKVKKTAIYSIIENLVAAVFITLTIITIIFLISKNVLQSNYAYYTEHSLTTTQKEQQLNNDIKKLNNELKKIALIQKNFKKWSTFLIDLNKLISAHIQITHLEITLPEEGKEEKNLKINGKAKKREALLLLQDNLKNCPSFQEVESPLSNILEKEDIEFSFNIKFNQ